MKEHVCVTARIVALTRFSSDRVNPSGPQEAPLRLLREREQLRHLIFYLRPSTVSQALIIFNSAF